MSLVSEILDRVKLDEIDSRIHELAGEAIREIAHAMDGTAPICDEKTLAMRELDLALMHFGIALRKHEKYQTAYLK